jgi:membrane-associated phospholipid phosphatase
MLNVSFNIVGEYRGLVPAGLLVLGLIVSGRTRAGLLSMLILGATTATVVALKPTFHRRPLIADREGYFPSTHAVGSFIAGAVLLLLAWRTRWRWPMLAVSLAFVSLYSASLVYSRAHYPSDVVGGWCIALFWTTGVALLLSSDNSPAPRMLFASGTSYVFCVLRGVGPPGANPRSLEGLAGLDNQSGRRLAAVFTTWRRRARTPMRDVGAALPAE